MSYIYPTNYGWKNVQMHGEVAAPCLVWIGTTIITSTLELATNYCVGLMQTLSNVQNRMWTFKGDEKRGWRGWAREWSLVQSSNKGIWSWAIVSNFFWNIFCQHFIPCCMFCIIEPPSTYMFWSHVQLLWRIFGGEGLVFCNLFGLFTCWRL